jgi:hypothetical protein
MHATKRKSTCGWCGVGVDLLLLSTGELWLLLAFPYPPGSASGPCPSPPGQLVACPFPPGQGLLHLSTFFSFQGFNPLLVCEMVWWWCENLEFSWLLWSGRIAACLSSQSCTASFCLICSVTMVVTTPHSVSMTELLVSCLPMCAISLWSNPQLSLTCDVVMLLCWYRWVVYPQLLKNRYYIWLITTQWCIDKLFCPSLRVKY